MTDKVRVVFQGEPGAYSEIASMNVFGPDIHARGLHDFQTCFEAIKKKEADYAVLPIENSTTGAIRQVYELLYKYDCYMIAETTVPIAHCLMGIPGTKIEDIQSVYSHEQGLFQCEEYLNEHPDWERIPFTDTAGSAKMVAELQDKHKAAICSSRAAEIYGLEVLDYAIQSNKLNTTRFVAISPMREFPEGRNKAVLFFTLKPEEASLSRILSWFEEVGLKLTRIESRPRPDRNWEYIYYVELSGDLCDLEVEKVFRNVYSKTDVFHLFGAFHSEIIKEG